MYSSIKKYQREQIEDLELKVIKSLLTFKRKGLNYLYGKRKVADDGVTTFPTHL